jgi:hypothetical protein
VARAALTNLVRQVVAVAGLAWMPLLNLTLALTLPNYNAVLKTTGGHPATAKQNALLLYLV